MGQGAQISEIGLDEAARAVRFERETIYADVIECRPHERTARARAGEQFRRSYTAFTPAKTARTVEFLIRLFDVVGALVILVGTFPAMAAAAALIKLTSSGPVLYRQERVGKGGRLFTLYKFRTMIDDAERHIGPVWASRDDCRVTPVGRVLRRMRLDELPQLYNILRGDMSLVGPRPERLYFVQRHRALQGIRLAVKPGLTGLAQIRSFYDLKPAHKVRYDYLYIQNRSLLLNVYILLQTVPVLFTKQGW